MRDRFYLFLTLRLYFPFCMWVYKGKGRPFPLSRMLTAPKESLARATGNFLQRMNLKPMPGYEEHDMKHTLLGFSASLRDEISMQYFEWGNGNRSLPVVTVIVFGSLIMPEEWRSYARAYQRGKEASPLMSVPLKDFAHRRLSELRKKWNIKTDSI